MKRTRGKTGSNSAKKGFTFLELMVGISIFTFALFPMMLMLTQSLAFGTMAGNRTIAMNEARRVMEDIRRVADTNGLASLVGMSWTGTSLSSETISVTDSSGNALQNNADPLPVRVTVSWSEKGKTTLYRIQTLVTQR